MDAHSSSTITSASVNSDMDAHSSTATSALLPPPPPAANEMKVAAAPAEVFEFEFEDMVFAVTEGNEVAEVLDGGAVRVLDSESFFDEDTGTREHLVDVYRERESMLLLVSVREDQRCIVGIRRWG